MAISAPRETLSCRQHFVRAQTAEINAARQMLRATGLGHLKATLRTATGRRNSGIELERRAKGG